MMYCFWLGVCVCVCAFVCTYECLCVFTVHESGVSVNKTITVLPVLAAQFLSRSRCGSIVLRLLPFNWESLQPPHPHVNQILHDFSTSLTLFRMNESEFNSEALQPLRTDKEGAHTSDGGAIDAHGEACDSTAYRLRLLIKVVRQGDVRYWEKWWKKVEKVSREENVDLCVVELLHNATKQPTPFQRKTFPVVWKTHFPWKHKGAEELQLPTEVRQCSKPTSFKGTNDEKRASSTKEKTPAHADGNTHEQGSTAAFSFQHWARHDITGAASQSWGGAQRQARSKKHMR